MGQPLVDIGLIWAILKKDQDIKSTGYNVFFVFMGFLPYWWRFWQCIHKWYKQGIKLQLVNACKYFSKFLPLIAVLGGSSKKVGGPLGWYVVFQLITTFFCLYWDFYWDWGLFRGTEEDNEMLRDEIKYSVKFYKSAMIANTFLRFWWVINLFHIKFAGPVAFLEGIQLMTFLSMMMEAIRRTVWSLIRVENELINNFEKYRTFIAIPPMKDENDLIEK